MRIERILCPTDFSGTSREATDCAVDLARAFDATIHLLHVIQDPVVYAPALGNLQPLTRREMEEFTEQALDNWIDPGQACGVRIQKHWVHGHPVEAILDSADHHDCNLIVMGTHGRGMIAHMLIGSVAERVVRRAACPVMTVHPTCAEEQAFDPVIAAVEG